MDAIDRFKKIINWQPPVIVPLSDDDKQALENVISMAQAAMRLYPNRKDKFDEIVRQAKEKLEANK